MTPAPTLSVIVPTYNRAAFVRTCLGSLLGCGVPEIEIVVADDGSTDDTESVAGAAGPAVRYARQANAGPAAARNLGFAASSGRYVAFLDCDDQWIAGAPLRALEALNRHPSAAAIFADARRTRAGEVQATYLETYGRDDFRALNATNLGFGLHRLARGPLLRQLVRRNVIFLGSLILRREIFSSLGGFDPRLRGAADWELILRLASEHELLFLADAPIAMYVLHSEGMSNDGDHMEEDFVKALVGLLARGHLDPGERVYVENALTRQRFGFAYQAYDRGDLGLARRRFAACLRHGPPSARTLTYYLASHLPSGLVRAGRTLKQRALP